MGERLALRDEAMRLGRTMMRPVQDGHVGSPLTLSRRLAPVVKSVAAWSSSVLCVMAVWAVLPQSAEAAWVPGTAYYISEQDADDWLERTYDFAYCQGVARFGKRGRFPYEEFVMFECSVTRGEANCPRSRWRAVKGSRVNYFRMRLVRLGSCY